MNNKHLTLLIGPAKYPEDDERMVSMFLKEPGKKIICGSSTANMVANVLPPDQKLDSVNDLLLVTDGTVILSEVLDIFNNQGQPVASTIQSDAQILASSLTEATSISFLIGMAVNKSQRSLSLPAKPIVKSRLARELVEILKSKGKHVTVEYF
ncbi:phosphatase [Desulforamulus ferrireducens]|uniref:Phosphatase n=1 Tax=Desulforamulus ferrireducens TaxID=1833852 RepID=A0A1S6IW49_9FIRM|nr:phosphatase [Desulforamulus ferrireducens]